MAGNTSGIQNAAFSEAMLNMLRYAKGEILLALDEKGRILWISDNYTNAINLTKENIIGLDIEDFLTIKENHIYQMVADAKNDEILVSKAVLNVGNNVLLDAEITIYKNGDGLVPCIVNYNKEKILLDNIRANFDNVINLSGDIIIAIDSMGYIKSANYSTEDILGFRIAELLGKHINVICYESRDQSLLEEGMINAKHGKLANRIKVNMLCKRGNTKLPCDLSINSIIGQDVNMNGFLISARELATKESNELLSENLEHVEKEIEKLKSESDLKTQFIYNISHDLKTPITNIRGFAKLLYEGEFGTLNDEQKNYVKIIIDESERFTKLVQEILDVAKLSSGKIKLDLQGVDLVQLGENPSIKALKESMPKGVEFSWNVEYGVPTITADPNRLIQIFVNLIGNAIKFTEKGSIGVNIYKKAKAAKYVNIEVKDTGIGISAEDRKKIFKKFYQVQRDRLTMQEGSGTGLGLSIVNEIVKLHGGRVGLESELGKGSTFWFTLPIAGTKKIKKHRDDSKEDEKIIEPQA